jgi:hypothetical protein
MRPAATTFGIFADYPYIKMAQGGLANNGSFMDISATDVQVSVGTGSSPGTFSLNQYASYSSDPSDGSVSIRNIYFSTAAPGAGNGAPGDVWLQG